MSKNEMPSSRQAGIIAWLKEAQSLTITQLSERFEVSTMTIHRDLTQLQTLGTVKKVHGGVILTQTVENNERKADVCAMCNHKAPARTSFMVTWEGGEQSTYCCPHCGLLALHGGKTAVSTLARDFLYGRMINIFQAQFLVSSDVQLCCIPSTICFATKADAEKFQRGFGGKMMSYTEAVVHLAGTHLTASHHPPHRHE